MTIDEVGNRYGRLVVTERVERTWSGKDQWLCRCDCGDETVVRGDALRGSATRSCGCLRDEVAAEMRKSNSAMDKATGEVGKQYGRLTVVERMGTQGSNAMWLCQCECGRKTVARGTNLRGGLSTSCGWSRTLPDGEAAFNAMFTNRRHSARKRGLEWALTKAQVRTFAGQRCHYCGIEPSSVSHQPGPGADYVYNGMDRVDNSRGYTIDNVVTCCVTCNKAKNTMTQGEFARWIVRVYQRFARRFEDIDQEVKNG